MRGTGGGTRRVLEKLEKSVQEGNYYEAQQLYKSVYARYMASQNYEAVYDLLQSGACIQLKHGQVTCGVELALLLIEAFVNGKMEYTKDSLNLIKAIYDVFPRADIPQVLEQSETQNISEEYVAAKTRVEGCSTFLKAAIKWSAEFGGPKKGARELHDMLADYIWLQSPQLDLVKPSHHFVRGSQPDSFASAILKFMSQCYPDQKDVVLARAVFQYLSLGNLRDANKIMNIVKRVFESEGFEELPLVRCVKYLLLTLERDALPLFRMLREHYKMSIERDPALDELLDDIAEKFYGVRRRGGFQNMFGDIMKMFIN